MTSGSRFLRDLHFGVWHGGWFGGDVLAGGRQTQPAKRSRLLTFNFLFPLYGWADQRRREGNERDRGNAAEESHADDEMVANVAGPAPQNLQTKTQEKT